MGKTDGRRAPLLLANSAGGLAGCRGASRGPSSSLLGPRAGSLEAAGRTGGRGCPQPAVAAPTLLRWAAAVGAVGVGEEQRTGREAGGD